MTILALASAVPHVHLQEDIALKMIDYLKLSEPHLSQLKKLYANSAIRKRHSVVADFKEFLGESFPHVSPGMSRRNAIFKEEAPKLAFESAHKALENWGGDPKAITHLIGVTCTGVLAPGLEFLLINQLDLNPQVKRFGINFMGCFGAFKGLAVAKALAKEDPKNRVLVVCTELCSLHFQAATDLENLTGNSLFSDGSAAVLVGIDPKPFEKPLWEIVRSHCSALEATREMMSWEASDHGYIMRLSHRVPAILRRVIAPFVEELLEGTAAEQCVWPIHPGGKSIIQAIEKALNLESSQTQASWDILSEYGNMSSATFLFVLERLLQLKTDKKWAVGLGFGPGLSVEGVFLKYALR